MREELQSGEVFFQILVGHFRYTDDFEFLQILGYFIFPVFLCKHKEEKEIGRK